MTFFNFVLFNITPPHFFTQCEKMIDLSLGII